MDNAVYLIIAGALLGPIEPSVVGNIDQTKFDECLRNIPAHSSEPYSTYDSYARERATKELATAMSSSVAECRHSAGAARETIAETCERAMKEIGAYMVGSSPSGKPPHNPGLIWHSTEPGNPIVGKTGDWVVKPIIGNAAPVLCIPAPSGLKR